VRECLKRETPGSGWSGKDMDTDSEIVGNKTETLLVGALLREKADERRREKRE
jgi:hypothetical protein